MSMYKVGTDLKNLKPPIPIEEIIGWILTIALLVAVFLIFAYMQGKAPIVDGHI